MSPCSATQQPTTEGSMKLGSSGCDLAPGSATCISSNQPAEAYASRENVESPQTEGPAAKIEDSNGEPRDSETRLPAANMEHSSGEPGGPGALSPAAKMEDSNREPRDPETQVPATKMEHSNMDTGIRQRLQPSIASE
ncbi:hypothetical protein DUNSADRAFT_8473 [Dunaliella salina]|uniref:Encoded protein n=1 Tax=Dunaliella salina TaxID=3046 RepID=A0ABQ7GJG6_DUNSA|nr:hypothetical protein DUNSADRAFT_8473 [Dunaliella salina]|eukprot:KAF5834746.1 hypothetical protein DUNSADRAFT_8473 [Dunaliella salina]